MRTARTLLLALLLGLGACIAIPFHSKTPKRKLPEKTLSFRYDWVEIPAGKNTVLRGIYVEGHGPVVLLLYGSGMGIRGSMEAIEFLVDGGYSVLCADYRGTGYSSGSWSSRALDDDARVLWEWARNKKKDEPAGVLGISVGAIAATGLAEHPHPPAAIILDRPVDPRTVIRRWLETYVGSVAGAVSRAMFRAGSDVNMRQGLARMQSPTLLLLPELDVLCPAEDVDHMMENASPKVRRVIVRGGHLSSHVVDPKKWRAAALDFLDEHLRPGLPELGGRHVPPDPVTVVDARFQATKLALRFDRRAEAGQKIILCGSKANAWLRLPRAGDAMELPVPYKHVRRLGKLLGVRAVGPTFKRPIGTRWVHEKDRRPKSAARDTMP